MHFKQLFLVKKKEPVKYKPGKFSKFIFQIFRYFVFPTQLLKFTPNFLVFSCCMLNFIFLFINFYVSACSECSISICYCRWLNDEKLTTYRHQMCSISIRIVLACQILAKFVFEHVLNTEQLTKFVCVFFDLRNIQLPSQYVWLFFSISKCDFIPNKKEKKHPQLVCIGMLKNCTEKKKN